MKILSIDTASNICGVSILEDDKLICNLDTDTGRTHSENLMPMIEQAFNKTNLSLKNIDLITCDIGPGSFTGIRIGVATTKAFNNSLNIPCIGISSLESLAYNLKDTTNENDIICSIMDCKNNNCYFALYRFDKDNYQTIENPIALSKEEVLSLLNEKYNNQSITFVGDGFCEKSVSNTLDVTNLGIAGFTKYKNNNNLGEEIVPMYLKKTQAEKQLEEKLKN